MEGFNVSIIIPLYNREKYISKAVESCINLPQIGEIIIIDDGSTDNSVNEAKKLATLYSKIKVLQHPDKKNHGCSAARNLGIKNAECSYIAFLDSDDQYLPNRFDNEERIFKQNPDIDGVYGITSTEFENQEADKAYQSKINYDIIKIREYIEPEKLYKSLLADDKGHFSTDAITLKKKVFEKAGYFPEYLKIFEDVSTWIRIAATAKLISNGINEPIAVRYVHNSNTILNSDDILLKSMDLMYETLFIWALDQKFTFDKTNDFYIFYQGSRLKNKKELKFFLKFIINNPKYIFNPFSWRKTLQLLKQKAK